MLKKHFDTHIPAATLQDIKQFLPGHAGKSMAAGPDPVAFITHLNLVPIGKCLPDLPVGLLILSHKVAEGFIREYDTKTKRIVCPVAFINCNVVPGVCDFHKQGEVQAARPAANYVDFEGSIHWSIRPFYCVPEISKLAISHKPG